MDLHSPNGVTSDDVGLAGPAPTTLNDSTVIDEMDGTSKLKGDSLGGFDFSGQPEPYIAGTAVIVLVAFLAASLQLSPWMFFLVIALAGFITGTLVVFHERSRWNEAWKAYRNSQSIGERWHRKLKELHDSSEQSSTALSQMTDGVVVLSPEANIRLINQAAHRLFGLSTDSNYLTRPFFEVVRIPETTEALRLAQQGEVPQVVTVEVVNGAGVRPVRVQIDRISDRPGSSMLLSARDETQIHQMEAIRREFVANVSHEIKTPIAAIKGFVETTELAMEDDQQSARRFLGQIQGQCLRLERLVRDLIQVARAQSGKQHLRFSNVQLLDVVNEAMGTLRPIADARKISVAIEPSEDAWVHADYEAMVTIANNLISNAIYYTKGGGHVQVCFQKEHDFWALVVQDDGVGIPEAEHDRIFERFYRVDRNRSSASGGTGIGLAMVKNLTVAQNGMIRLQSAPGEGATFEVLLPATDPVSIEQPSSEPHPEKEVVSI